MRAVKDTAPENPDALPLDIEEMLAVRPPGSILTRQEIEPRPGEGKKFFDIGADAILCRQDIVGSGFRHQQKLGEKPAFAEQLMAKNIAHRPGPRMRAPPEVGVVKNLPNRNGLAALAGIGINRMLEARGDRAWHVGFGNGGMWVIHGFPLHSSQGQMFRKWSNE